MVEETIVGVIHILPHLRGHLLQDFEKIEGEVQGFVEQKMRKQSKMKRFESRVSAFTCN